MKNILWGGIIIAIGLFNGSSVFLGNPGALDYVFDGIGTVLIVIGIVQVIQSKKAS